MTMRYCRTAVVSHTTHCFVVGFASSNMRSSSDCHFQKTSSRQHSVRSRFFSLCNEVNVGQHLTLPYFSSMFLFAVMTHDFFLLLQAAPFCPALSAVQLSALRCLTFLDASQNKIRTLELMAQTHFKATFLEHGGK